MTESNAPALLVSMLVTMYYARTIVGLRYQTEKSRGSRS